MMISIIAEIGVNWDGDFDLAKEMMNMAKKYGCDYVKYQSFNENIVKKHPEKSRLMKSAISPDNIETIDEIAKKIGIEWFCTPMYPEAVDFLNPYVNKFKIRELDGRPLLENKTSDLIERIFNTGKESYISSQKSPLKIKIKNSNLKWLYCVPKYPCSLSDLDFSRLNEFDGYSNHCPDIRVPVNAANLGAKIIEVHITSDKSKKFFDNAVSFDYDDLNKLVQMIRKSKNISK